MVIVVFVSVVIVGLWFDDVFVCGVLCVCMMGDYKLYLYYCVDGCFEGIDIDMVELFVKLFGVKIDYVKMSWLNFINDFVVKCDIVVGGVLMMFEC